MGLHYLISKVLNFNTRPQMHISFSMIKLDKLVVKDITFGGLA